MTTRREMLIALAALATVPACQSGGGGVDTGPRTDAGRSCDSTTSTISSNHGHSLTVSGADVVAGASRTYDIQGSAAHPHSITLGAADFTVLRTSGSVIVASTAGGGHTHMVTVRCA